MVMQKTKKQIQYEIKAMLKTIKHKQEKGEDTKALQEIVESYQSYIEKPQD